METPFVRELGCTRDGEALGIYGLELSDVGVELEGQLHDPELLFAYGMRIDGMSQVILGEEL